MKKLYFIGIGGVSMSGISYAFLQNGFHVEGSDFSTSETNSYIKELEKANIKVHFGHKAQNLPEDLDFVVKTSTVLDDNPEILEAKRRNIKIINRYEALNQLLCLSKNRIGVIGSAGKTTTTAFAYHIFVQAGLLPSLYFGSLLNGHNFSVNTSEDKTFSIAETDESDGSFSEMDLNSGLFLQIEADHLEYSKYQNSFSVLTEYFKKSVHNIANKNGNVVYLKDCPVLSEIILSSGVRAKSFSLLDEEADFYASNVKQNADFSLSFDFYFRKKCLAENVKLETIGLYNIKNFIGGLAMLSCFKDIEKEDIHLLSQNLPQIDKRLSVVGRTQNVTVIDDYAHSPLKISSLIFGVKKYTDENDLGLICVFEAHKYTRVRNMYQQYLDVFSQIPSPDKTFMMEIFAVPGYVDTFGITNESFCYDINLVNQNLNMETVLNCDLNKRLLAELSDSFFVNKKNTIVLFFGAGLSSKYAKDFSKFLIQNQIK